MIDLLKQQFRSLKQLLPVIVLVAILLGLFLLALARLSSWQPPEGAQLDASPRPTSPTKAQKPTPPRAAEAKPTPSPTPRIAIHQQGDQTYALKEIDGKIMLVAQTTDSETEVWPFDLPDWVIDEVTTEKFYWYDQANDQLFVIDNFSDGWLAHLYVLSPGEYRPQIKHLYFWENRPLGATFIEKYFSDERILYVVSGMGDGCGGASTHYLLSDQGEEVWSKNFASGCVDGTLPRFLGFDGTHLYYGVLNQEQVQKTYDFQSWYYDRVYAIDLATQTQELLLSADQLPPAQIHFIRLSDDQQNLILQEEYSTNLDGSWLYDVRIRQKQW